MTRDNESWIGSLRDSGAGREEALSDLRGILLHGLRRPFCNRAGVDESFLEDVAQQSLLRILEKLSEFEGRSQFVTWATSIAIRVAMTDLRHRRWRDVSLDAIGSVTAEQAVDPDGDPAQNAQRQSVVDAMYRVIETGLTARQRTALLAEVKGMAQCEIARQLGITQNALYKLTHDARKRLKRGLEAAGYEAGDVQALFEM